MVVGKGIIREVRKEDLWQVLGLLHQLSPPGKEPGDETSLKEALVKMVDSEHYNLCVLEEDGKLIGTAMLLVQLNLSHGGKAVGHIENVVVDPAQRGRGIGKQMIGHLLERAAEKSCYKVVLSCNEDNTLFYKSCGLKKHEVGMRFDL